MYTTKKYKIRSHTEKYDSAGHKYRFIVMTYIFINLDGIHKSKSDLQIRTITCINGSSRFGFVKRELIDWSTFDIFRAGV